MGTPTSARLIHARTKSRSSASGISEDSPALDDGNEVDSHNEWPTSVCTTSSLEKGWRARVMIMWRSCSLLSHLGKFCASHDGGVSVGIILLTALTYYGLFRPSDISTSKTAAAATCSDSSMVTPAPRLGDIINAVGHSLKRITLLPFRRRHRMSNVFFHLTRRLYSRVAVLVATAILVLVAFPFNRSLIYSLLVYRRYPPLYPQYHQLELELPHYASYEHSDVKYLWSPNHPDKVGWGNIMQDYILSYVLAHSCNRSFVFDDYTWANDGTQYSHFNGKLIPSRIPLNALIQGPLVGGPLPPADNTPQAVHKDFFHKVCPNPTILRLSDVTGWSDSDTVEFIIAKWVEKITSIEDPCLQFEEISADKQIFNYMVYAQKDRLMSIWPYMSNLSALSHWGWSPLVHDAFEVNREFIYPPASYWPPGQYSRLDEVMGGLLVMHVRRGDFSGHCRYLAKANSEWNTFNSFPGLPDKYDQVQSNPQLSSANRKAFMDHCYPSFEWIVEKVRTVREESQQHLEYIYIMTNGDSSWTSSLKTALYDLGGWVYVGSNRDLSLTWEQKFVAQAVDMLVAQRAQVFIGNGWSSLSSNIVLLRTVDGLPPEGNRFW